MLLDLLEPPGRCSGCWPHDGEVAGGDVASSFSRIVVRRFRFGATMEVGRSARPTDDDVGFAWSGRRRAGAASHGVIDNDRQILQH
jgi:hypothetical protein